MAFQVQGTVALVTGANRGIGKAIVEGLLAAGAAKVYAAVRDANSAEALVQEHGERVAVVPIDLAQPGTIADAAGAASDVQLVVNNAGVFRAAKPLDDDALDALGYQMDINVGGLIHIAREFAPVLKANGGGALVQLNSVASLRAFTDFAMYAASKAAAYSVTQALRNQLREQGTVVVSVHPGPIDTDMAHQAGLEAMAEPASVVADAIIAALWSGEFHAFPDSTARDIGAAYKGFADMVINTADSEA